MQDNKKKELHAKIDQARNGVTDFTTSIDMMRQSRDIKNTEIDTFQRELQVTASSFKPYRAKSIYLNFQPFEIVSRYLDPQPQVVENYLYLLNLRPIIYK